MPGFGGFPKAEITDHPGQRAGLVGQQLGRGGGLFNQAAVALGELVHMADGLADLLQTCGLLLRGQRSAISATLSRPCAAATVMESSPAVNWRMEAVSRRIGTTIRSVHQNSGQ